MPGRVEWMTSVEAGAESVVKGNHQIFLLFDGSDWPASLLRPDFACANTDSSCSWARLLTFGTLIFFELKATVVVLQLTELLKRHFNISVYFGISLYFHTLVSFVNPGPVSNMSQQSSTLQTLQNLQILHVICFDKL